jgi:hypothetical protein
MFTKYSLNKSEYDLCLKFSLESAKTQREYRSGGTQFRSIEQIQNDTMRGKVAEVITQNFLKQTPLLVEGITLDFNIYPRGKWDDQDFTINNIRVAIKSAKWFSKWLLLETKDILRGDVYDYYIFVTVDEDFSSGTVKGFATKNEILNDANTLKLTKGDKIPRTETILDADNHARHSNYLHNSEKEWLKLADELKLII